MENSLQQFINCQKELYNRDALVFDEGFIIYKSFEDKSVYAHLIFIDKAHRSLGIGREMVNELISHTQAETLYSYVDTTTQNPELSLKAHLDYGFKIYDLGTKSIQLIYQTNKGETNV